MDGKTAVADGSARGFRRASSALARTLVRQVADGVHFLRQLFFPKTVLVEVDVDDAADVGRSLDLSPDEGHDVIAPEFADQEAVFEEFRQVGTDVSKKHEGTGLGLALTRRFVELHGGNIWLESEVGVGSTFTFALPVRR